MSKWNYQTNSPNPTYIHNGNPTKLKKIINAIIKNEAKKIISHENIYLNKKKTVNIYIIAIHFIKKFKSIFLKSIKK
jgi:hypothetical protein